VLYPENMPQQTGYKRISILVVLGMLHKNMAFERKRISAVIHTAVYCGRYMTTKFGMGRRDYPWEVSDA
jgi:hypothetical protein